MAKKTTKPEESEASVIVAEEIPRGPIFVALQAAMTEAKILHNRGEQYDMLAEKYAELKQKNDDREKKDEESGESTDIVSSSGKITYTADSIPLQTMMETLAEVLAVLPANEITSELNNILILL